MVAAEQDQDASAQYWRTAVTAEAVLYRRILIMGLPFLKRTQVRREYEVGHVRGACFGVSRSRERQHMCKLSLPSDLDDNVRSGLRAIIASMAVDAPHFTCTSIQINVGLRAVLHTDTASIGPSLFL